MTNKKTPHPPKVYNKRPRSYTLTDETVELLTQLARMENRSRSNMFEFLVEKEAREKGLINQDNNYKK